MTTEEAIKVVMIMYHHGRFPAQPIASFLMAFPEVDLVEFFNVSDSFIDERTHDEIMVNLEVLRHAEKVLKGLK